MQGRYINESGMVQISNKNKCRYVIGIDPGKNTGVAVYDKVTKTLVAVETLSFWSCYDRVREYSMLDAKIVIECPMKTVMYQHQLDIATQGSVKRSNRMMANIASNAHEGDLLATRFEYLGFDVTRVRPTKTKHDRDTVRKITGYQKPTNQHTRDAIMLCWG